MAAIYMFVITQVLFAPFGIGPSVSEGLSSLRGTVDSATAWRHRRLHQAAPAPGGYVCSVKGTAKHENDGVVIRTMLSVRWALSWSTPPVGIELVKTGDIVEVNGRCDKSTQPFTLWATAVTRAAAGGVTHADAIGGPGSSSSGGPTHPLPSPRPKPPPRHSPSVGPSPPAKAPPQSSQPPVPKPPPSPSRKPPPTPPRPSPAPSPPPPPRSPPPSPRPSPAPFPSPRASAAARAAELSTVSWPPAVTSVPPQEVLTSLVVAVDFCDAKAVPDTSLVKATWANEIPTYFAVTSFGALTMPVDSAKNNVQLTHAQIGCSGTRSDGMTWTSKDPLNAATLRAWAEAADALVAKRGIDLSAFVYRIYLMPTSIGATSFGDIPYPPTPPMRVWGAYPTPNIHLANMIHELGHNLGLFHSKGYSSTGQLNEYGDLSCPMGSAPFPTHYNAAQSILLGWTKPQAVLRAADLSTGVWATFKLRGLADSAVSSLQIFPGSWMTANWGTSDQLIVSFRRYTPTNGDSGLLSQLRNKVQVHMFTPDPVCGCAPTVLLSNLDDTNSTVWPRPGSSSPADTASPQLVVRVLEVDVDAGAAYVSICRRPATGGAGSCV